MRFEYNNITIGATDKRTGSTVIVGKPIYEISNTDTLYISIQFYANYSTASAFWSAWETWNDEESGLRAPGKKLRLLFESKTITFDPEQATTPTGIPMETSIKIIGDNQETKSAKKMMFTCSIDLNTVLVNNYSNLSIRFGYTPIGQKVIDITANMPKVNVSGTVSALENFRENFESIAEDVIGLFDDFDYYKLLKWDIATSDKRLIETGHTPNRIAVNASYERIFYSEEVGKNVSTTLKDVNITITPQRFVNFSYIDEEAANTAIQHRLRIDYDATVVINSEQVGGSGEFYKPDSNIIVDDNFLAQVYEAICQPRMLEVANAQELGSFEIIDQQVSYFPNISRIQASIVVDNENSDIIEYEEVVKVSTHYRDYVPYTNGEDDDNYVESIGRVTIITVVVKQEAFRGAQLQGSSYTPSGVVLLDRDITTEKGTPRIKEIENGFPKYETTSVTTVASVYLKNKDQQFDEGINYTPPPTD